MHKKILKTYKHHCMQRTVWHYPM